MDTIRDLILNWEATHGRRHVAARRQYNMMVAALVGGGLWQVSRGIPCSLTYDAFSNKATLRKGDMFYYFHPSSPKGVLLRLKDIQCCEMNASGHTVISKDGFTHCPDFTGNDDAVNAFICRQNQFVSAGEEPREKGHGVTRMLDVILLGTGKRKPWWQGGRWQEPPKRRKFASMEFDKDIQKEPFDLDKLSARQWLLVQAMGLKRKLPNDIIYELRQTAMEQDNSIWDQLMLLLTGAYMDDVVRAAMKEHGLETTDEAVDNKRNKPGHEWIRTTYHNMVNTLNESFQNKSFQNKSLQETPD